MRLAAARYFEDEAEDYESFFLLFTTVTVLRVTASCSSVLHTNLFTIRSASLRSLLLF